MSAVRYERQEPTWEAAILLAHLAHHIYVHVPVYWVCHVVMVIAHMVAVVCERSGVLTPACKHAMN